MPAESLDKVILSFPTLISLAAKERTDESPRSWIQLAKTGSWKSNRYGKFSITKDDLSTMLTNFNTVTPLPTPGEGKMLPMDYDHLSMDPKKPGDGKAAGWIKKLELRENGSELWGLVEWTEPAAESIEKGEYKFVSPSFVKDHVHKDGKKVGTTLLAAAITNHPFLEGMASLTLNSVGELGTPPKGTEMAVLNLAEIGQRVMIAPGEARSQDEVGGTFEIAEVVGEGDDAFVSVKDANGVVHKWFRATELLPASATPANPEVPNLPPAKEGLDPAAAAAAGGAAAPAAPDPAAILRAAALNPADAAAAIAAAGAPAAAAGAPAAKPGEEPKPGAEKTEAAEKKNEQLKTGEGTPKKGPDGNSEGATGAAGAEGSKADTGTEEEDEAKKQAAAAAAAGKEPAKGLETQPKAGDNASALDEMLKKVMAALAAGQVPQKGMNMKFNLTNDKGEKFEVTADQLKAAGVEIVPEGSVAVAKTELDGLQGKVTNLSERLDASEKTRVKGEFEGEIKRLKDGALITGAQEEFARKTWGESMDLSAFRSWAATFTTPIVSLNKEHGSSGKPEGEKKDAGTEATEKIISLANTYVKERGMSLRDATIQASRDLEKESEAYREQFASV